MKKYAAILITLVLVTSFFISVCAQEPELPKPQETEVWEPVPEVVTPGKNMAPPSDAIVLFDGKNADQWKQAKDGKPVKWDIKDGVMTVKPKTGAIVTKEGFGDCQLHVEWRAPLEDDGEGQKGGNSGIFLQNRYEVQILNSHENRTYSNGQAASIYKQYMPLVNACKPRGEWQAYDIFYTAPRFNDDSSLKSPGYVTVVQNGILVQNHVEIQGTTAFRGKPQYKAHSLKEPIQLQDHGDLVSFRNIWIREL